MITVPITSHPLKPSGWQDEEEHHTPNSPLPSEDTVVSSKRSTMEARSSLHISTKQKLCSVHQIEGCFSNSEHDIAVLAVWLQNLPQTR
jgi:hypothetical protein